MVQLSDPIVLIGFVIVLVFIVQLLMLLLPIKKDKLEVESTFCIPPTHNGFRYNHYGSHIPKVETGLSKSHSKPPSPNKD